MRHETFNQLVEEILEEAKQVLVLKDAEYSSDSDRLHNFKVAGFMSGTPPEAALWGMLVKHLTSVRDICYSNEMVTKTKLREKLGDVINYMILLEAVLYDSRRVSSE